MAIRVNFNEGSQISLNVLNHNQSHLSKTLERLTSGQKFIGAQGNSSDYAISEKMLEQIRSLFQDDQNVQNGSSMVRTAERGIDQIVSNLRTMKELAIDAANDSNTDEDRAAIQKEFEARRAVINDIAIGTEFNSKILLDGRWVHGGIQPTKAGSGGTNTSVTDLISAFSAGTNAVQSDKNISYSRYNETLSEYVPYSQKWSFEVGSQSYDVEDGYYSFSVNVDFSSMQVEGAFAESLHNQGFTILCGACKQYVNILFDCTISAEESRYDPTGNEDNYLAREFNIGVKGVKDPESLADALIKGIYSVSDKISGVPVSTPNNVYIDNQHRLRMVRDDSGQISIWKIGKDVELQFMEGTIPNPVKDPIPPAIIDIRKDNPLWVQHGTQAGQRIQIFIKDMKSKALGIDEAEVTTREKANTAIGIINNAIETALDEATTMGAYLQRLEATFANVVTMRENAQGSESTIRDADMAKEVTDYMKYNLLSQSAESMLAQSNQSGYFVLGMLQ